MIPFDENPALFIEDYIKSLARESEANRLQEIDGTPIFEEPLVRYASGDDPLFTEYKKIIGDFHLTPREALEKSLGPSARDQNLEELSLVCWVLPITQKTRMTNRTREQLPSLRWGHTRHHGEAFNNVVRERVVDLLKERGYLAVAPMTASVYPATDKAGIFQWFHSPDGPTSNWSERHINYAAGMGTFSLSDGFITPRGIALRCGSVVTNLKLPPSERKYAGPYANCPFKVNGSCGECIDRCPVGAITAKGHDKKKCEHYILEEIHLMKWKYGVSIIGCGLCQTRVPCESRIPSSLLGQ